MTGPRGAARHVAPLLAALTMFLRAQHRTTCRRPLDQHDAEVVDEVSSRPKQPFLPFAARACEAGRVEGRQARQ